MAGLVDWRVIESMTGWAIHKSSEEADRWDDGAAEWGRRTEFEEAFTQAQIAALDILPTDAVLDACCGTGRLTIPLARRARSVTGLDAGQNMLDYCAGYARREGLDNVRTILVSNWHDAQPGIDFPVHDVVLACISPASSDIIKLSQCARRQCYSLSFNTPYKFMNVLASLFSGVNDRWPSDSSERLEDMQLSKYDTCRLFGVNVPFNILFDAGASPTIQYVTGGWSYCGSTREDVYEYLAGFGEVPPSKIDLFRSNVDKHLEYNEAEGYVYRTPDAQMYVLGWNPSDVDVERAEQTWAKY